MSKTSTMTGITSKRKNQQALNDSFADLHPPLSPHEAAVAADRCYYCYDAPCVTACPTSIDIPNFIRSIATGQEKVAAKTILNQNILGGMCARVCPTEVLCEEACVREKAEGKPVKIGLLQRFATDAQMKEKKHPYHRASATGKKIIVIGSGPAGLACAHRLALYGNEVDIIESKSKGGGLNEYGIAAYKTVNDFAQSELNWLLGIGGINIQYERPLQGSQDLKKLRDEYDAVFLAMGLSNVRNLNLTQGDQFHHVRPAIDFIADLRQANDLQNVTIGRQIIVIGGGMTAVDTAIQAKKLGAEDVTIVYRRKQERMSASKFEQNLAQTHGVKLLFEASLQKITGSTPYKALLRKSDDTSITLEADQIFTAIGQILETEIIDLQQENGKIKIDKNGATSCYRIWAGGDCASGGDDLTVTAVAEGRDAAEHIHQTLIGE